MAIFVLVLLFLTALIGLRTAYLDDDREAALTGGAAAMRTLALVGEQYAERVFETSDLVTTQVVARIEAMGGIAAVRDSAALHAWLRNLAERMAGDYLTVVDHLGRPVLSSTAHPAPTELDLSDQRWFRAHTQHGQAMHIGRALHNRVTNEILFTFARSLHRPDGTFDGVVKVAMRTGFFQAPSPMAEFGQGAVMGLFDAEGHVLSRTGLTPAQFGTRLPADIIARIRAGELAGNLRTGTAGGGQDRMVAFRQLANWPVVVTAEIPVDGVLAPWQLGVGWSVEVIAIVAIGLLLLSVFVMRLADAEAEARAALAWANKALRESAAGLENRVAERTRDLTASETRFRVIFDSAFQLMALLDRRGRILEMNETALDFLGLGRATAIGYRIQDLPCWPDATTRAALADAIVAAAAGTARRHEIAARTADGRLAPVEISLRPVTDPEGGTAWLVAEGHDLTELKAAEARLREAQKMEALGQLTGSVAHDFNNLLMVVLGNLGLLRKRLPSEPRLMRLLDGAQQGAERGAALTSRMLAFARRQELRPEPVDLAALVRGMGALLERSAGPTVHVVLDLPTGLPPALVDANQLELALINLAVNARDAMPQGGQVTISVAEAHAHSAAGPPGLTPGTYLRMAVTDTGAGMDAATLARATEPFFTTKGVGRGSGLGLSMVQGLAQQSGGGLRLTSWLGAGTTAEIWLPTASAGATPRPAPVLHPAAVSVAQRRVLVVDDDPLVAAGTAMMLEDLGHSASIAASAEDALALLGREAAPDLVLTDHAMPGITGLELAERLLRDWPDLPVVLATGYAEVTAGAAPWLPRLAKPYRQDELALLINRLTQPRAA